MSVNLNALKQYKSVGHTAAAQTASPHQLIVMLFDGALTALATAKGFIERKDIQGRSKQLNKASDIILGLRDFLDHEKGGEIAANLDALYDYMVRAISQANRDSDADKVQEVINLLLEVRSGWVEMEKPA